MSRARVPARLLLRAASLARPRAREVSSPWRHAEVQPQLLPAAFYDRPTLDVARDLLGKLVVYASRPTPVAGLIVEVEAYIGESDPACHAAPGPTRRNEPLYGPPGRSYLYLNYGMHVLVNAVTERKGFPAAVLIRALDPILGVDHMRVRRAGATLHTGDRGAGGRAAKREGDRAADGAPPTAAARAAGAAAGGAPGGAVDRGTSRVATPAGRKVLTPPAFEDVELCRGPGRLSRALGLTLALNRGDLSTGPLAIADIGIEPKRVVWTTRVGLNVGTEHPWRAVVDGSPCVSPWRGGGRKTRRKG